MLLLLPQHHAAAQRLHLVLVDPKTPLARCYAKKTTVAVSTIWQYCRKLSCISKVTLHGLLSLFHIQFLRVNDCIVSSLLYQRSHQVTSTQMQLKGQKWGLS